MKQKLKQQKGITLIALIVTIIVLLILATVSVKLIVDNGIVGRSKNATSKYTIAEEKEKIALAYNEYKMSRVDIDKNPEVNPEDFDLLERYCLGEEKKGISLPNIVEWGSSNYISIFKGNDIIPDAMSKLRFVDLVDKYNSNGVIIFFTYNGKEYQLTENPKTGMTEKLELINSNISFTIDGATVNGSENRGWKIRFNKTGNTYELKLDGEIINGEGVTEELELLERYFLGENGETVFWDTIYREGCNYDSFIDNNIIPDASTKIKLVGYNFVLVDKCFCCYFEYENKVYGVWYNINTGVTQSVEFLYAKQGREGQRVKYSYDGTTENEKDWLIVHDYGDKVEIMSLEGIGSLTLGKEDETAVGSDDIEKAIYSYNNAVKRIHEYTNSLVTNPNKISVRAAGSNPDNPLSENNEMYVSKKLGKYSGKLKGRDNNASKDLVLIFYYINEFENFQDDFLMPSRYVEADKYNDGIEFYLTPVVSFFRYENTWNGSNREDVYEPNNYEINGKVIPMVTISADSIKQ